MPDQLEARLRRDARDLARWKKGTPPPYTAGTESLIRDLNEAAAALERLEKLERERAEWVEAWDMVRDSILNDYGPLEINTVLDTIDYHDPRPVATPAPAPQQGGEG